MAAPSAPEPLPALVVGGGMAGLLWAWHLQRRGVRVQVWEASDRPGGWVETLPWDGRQAERGPQSLPLRPGGAVARLVAALGLAPRHLGRRPRWAALEGHLVPVPRHSGDFLTSPLLSVPGRARVLAGLLWPRQPQPGESLAAWTRRRFGVEAATRLLPLATRGLFATAPEHLDPGALDRRSLGDPVTFPGGLGDLPAALAADLDLRLGCPALALTRRGSHWLVTGPQGIAAAREVVLALPAFAAADLLAPAHPQAADLLRALPYVSVATWHSRHRPLASLAGGHGFLVHPGEGSRLLGCTVVGDEPLHLRAFTEPGVQAWSEVDAALRRYVPDLGPAGAVLRLEAPRALAAPPPGHAAWLAALPTALPPGMAWIGAARFGQGLASLVEGIAARFAG